MWISLVPWTLLTFYLDRFLDHWAHLGGAAFGVWYYMYGSQMWEKLRLAQLVAASEVQPPKEPRV